VKLSTQAKIEDASDNAVPILAVVAVLVGLWIVGVILFGWPLGLAFDLLFIGIVILSA
jgi:divalent metal cation (Fe/Co/Zn/Cd) transporter